MGTFIANTMGSLLLSITLTIFQANENLQTQEYWSEVITIGFCGCLTTVSTFVSEILNIINQKNNNEKNNQLLFKFNAFKYCVITFFVAQILSSIPNAIAYYA